jgi:hypothetical protein
LGPSSVRPPSLQPAVHPPSLQMLCLSYMGWSTVFTHQGPVIWAKEQAPITSPESPGTQESSRVVQEHREKSLVARKTLQARGPTRAKGCHLPSRRKAKGTEKPGTCRPCSLSERSGDDTAGNGGHHGLLCREVTGRKWCLGHTLYTPRCQTCIQRND